MYYVFLNICSKDYNFLMRVSVNSVLFSKLSVKSNYSSWNKLREMVKM